MTVEILQHVQLASVLRPALVVHARVAVVAVAVQQTA